MYFYLSKILYPLINPINALIIIYLTSVLLNIKFKKKYLKFFSKLSLSILLIISLLPIGKIGLIFLERDYINQKKLRNISNIIVLGGAEELSITEKTNKTNLNSASERLISVVKLSNRYLNAKIYYLGGSGSLVKNKKSISELNVAKNFFNDVDFDVSRITFIGETRNTIENFQKLNEMYSINNKETILITSASHMKRAMIISQYFGNNFTPYAVDFKSGGEFNLIRFYQSFDVLSNLSSFKVFYMEILGILAFKLFY